MLRIKMSQFLGYNGTKHRGKKFKIVTEILNI